MRYLLCLLWLSLALTAVAGTVSDSAAGSEKSASVAIEGLSADAAGLAIFTEADRRLSDYEDMTVALKMTLRNARGAESLRELRIRQMEMADDGDRLMVVFDTPKPIRGTALLSYAHKSADDDQWLFLPAIKRVKKITSQNRSGPFLSSEFAYEDLAPQEVEKFSYRFQGREQLSGTDVFVVERTPHDRYSGYTRQVVYLDVEELRTLRIDYYDRQDRPLKTLEVSGYELIDERFWKPRHMLMTNLQNSRSTELDWLDYRFGNNLDPERDFSTNSLRRAR